MRELPAGGLWAPSGPQMDFCLAKGLKAWQNAYKISASGYSWKWERVGDLGLHFCLESIGKSEMVHRQMGQETQTHADAPWMWTGFLGHRSSHLACCPHFGSVPGPCDRWLVMLVFQSYLSSLKGADHWWWWWGGVGKVGEQTKYVLSEQMNGVSGLEWSSLGGERIEWERFPQENGQQRPNVVSQGRALESGCRVYAPSE